jgi:hypothetical protein
MLTACGLSLSAQAAAEREEARTAEPGKDEAPEAVETKRGRGEKDEPTPREGRERREKREGRRERGDKETGAREEHKTEEIATAGELGLRGKLVAETRKGEDGTELTVYSVELENGEKIALPHRADALPKDVDLAALVGKTVTVTAQTSTRTRGGKVIRQVRKVTAIEVETDTK